MQFPESWLREFCNPPLSTQQLADLLTMSGMEVEELRPVAPPFTGVVVAQILTAELHPQAPAREQARDCIAPCVVRDVITDQVTALSHGLLARIAALHDPVIWQPRRLLAALPGRGQASVVDHGPSVNAIITVDH